MADTRACLTAKAASPGGARRTTPGPVASLEYAFGQLGWRWLADTRARADVGWECGLLGVPKPWLQHTLREGLRRASCKRVPAARQDMGDLRSAPAGLGMVATTATLRARSGPLAAGSGPDTGAS